MLSSPYPVPRSRLWQAFMLVGGVAAAGAGVWVLTDPPKSYQGLGLALTLAWGIFLVLGASLAVAGHALRQYRLELPGLYFLGGGVGLYCYLSWEQVVTGSPGSGPRALLLVSLGCYIAARLVALHIIDRRIRRIDDLARR
ncbi:hypothetical protein [Brachybacterium phenoliresistens]|uniref:hypothetical protein n=1 Tax=Brachybacterium phenoliresistens TaxID=396014 RepID=UPI0031DF940C